MLVRPAAWRSFATGSTEAYSLTPAAWEELRRAGAAVRAGRAAGFAASAYSDEQLAVVRLWLDGGSRPDGLAFDADLHGRLLRTLAARGIRVPGQEELLGRSWLAQYRDRYFAEAMPALAGREVRVMRHLARALYPATLAEPATLAATAAALERGDRLSHGLRLVLLEQEAILRSVLAARSVAPRWR